VLTIVGYATIAVITVISMAQGHASLLTVILRARLLPWWCGVLLIVAFPLGAVANAIFSSAENLLLALLWGSMGIALLSRREGVADPVATQPAQAG
jgi:hypothetical protein